MNNMWSVFIIIVSSYPYINYGSIFSSRSRFSFYITRVAFMWFIFHIKPSFVSHLKSHQKQNPLCLLWGELTCIVEGLNPIQVFIHFLLDPVQFGPCHASINEGLSCLLWKSNIKEAAVRKVSHPVTKYWHPGTLATLNFDQIYL